jgi:hypothetical protein
MRSINAIELAIRRSVLLYGGQTVPRFLRSLADEIQIAVQQAEGAYPAGLNLDDELAELRAAQSPKPEPPVYPPIDPWLRSE